MHDGVDSRTGIGQPGSSSLVATAFLFCFALSLLGNVFQGWRNLSLSRDHVAVAASRVEATLKTESDVGNFVRPFRVSTAGGLQVSLGSIGKAPTAIYVFDPHCGWCERNLDSIRVLAKEKGSDVKFVGLVRYPDGLSAYLQKNPLPFQAFSAESPSEADQLGFMGTPQTVLLDAQGRIIHNWIGAYQGPVRESIESYFGVKLPELRHGL